MKVRTRMGDGSVVELSEGELKRDLEEGTEDAAERGEIPTLSEDELSYLFDIFKAPYKFISVQPGNEIVLTYDGIITKLARVGMAPDRAQALQIYEKALGADTIEFSVIDYTYKALKNIMPYEQGDDKEILFMSTVSLFYGAFENSGAYN